MKILYSIPMMALSAGLLASKSSADVLRGAEIGDVRLTGIYGGVLKRIVERNVKSVDVAILTDVFRQKTERNRKWQTEFWGKYMLSAVPYWQLTGDEGLSRAIDEGTAKVIALQEPDGYIGNYPPDLRCDEGWDIWGMKYTLLGLLQHNAAKESAQSLAAARKLCDFLIAKLGPGAYKTIGATGNFSGLPSCSSLDAVIGLYRATKDDRYLDFASFIVGEMEKHAALLSSKDVPVYLRDEGKRRSSKDSRLKAYEFMSCMQGLLDYWEVIGEKRFLEVAVAAGNSILRDEVNLAGGASCNERWFHGAIKQHLQYGSLQETCVVTTWMRLCEKLLAATCDPKWADALEMSFYNAYLAALKSDGTRFTSYTPLNGSRTKGHEQCWMHQSCCNANGPRGFLSVLHSALMADESTAFLNLYLSGTMAILLPSCDQKLCLDVYTHYPLRDAVRIENKTAVAADFTLALRIPAWSMKTDVSLNGEPIGVPGPGSYLKISRHWKPGDVVELVFDQTIRVHRLEHAMAFTRGPIALVRDNRFDDGDIGETLRPWAGEQDLVASFRIVHRPTDAFRMTFVADLPLSPSLSNEFPDDDFNRSVRFCDYASGAGTWSDESWCRMWLPIEREGME